MSPSSILVIFLCFLQFSGGKETPDLKDVEDWAKEVDDKLWNFNYLVDVVRATYKEKSTDANPDPGIRMQYEKVNEEEMVQTMADSLAQMLKKKMDALKLSVEKAEEVAANYEWNKNLVKDNVHYVNAKEILSNGLELTYDERFGKGVNLNTSSVHIPVEIYDGNIDILNGLNWSAALEKQFELNYKADPEIQWQYFGSQTGFMRTYPATQWPGNGVDLYDVRRQSWYTQGSSSPKDMMILIDTSGSTHGQSLQLMQNAVKSILDTLGENDFVNIVSFAEKATFVSKCLNHTAFVQANYRNKKQLERDVDRLKALGQADFSEAIKFAFEKFIEFSQNETNDENNIGANCNKVIMLLTDGGTDNARDVFKKYNWDNNNKTVRVFTYAVGPTPNPITAVRWMACANRGYFSQIPAMGAIRARVQEYIPVLSRPQVIKNKKTFEWGNIYEDTLGLGMMTTVTLPVYNRSAGSSNQTILGVMGVDVTTAELESKSPFSKMGPNGYTFAINPNGYVVFHPNLKTGGTFMKEPPNVDIMELEVHREDKDDAINSLRNSMIEGNRGKKVITTLFLSPDQRYVTESQARYAFTPIENTTFRLGISVPLYQKMYPKFEGSIPALRWKNLESDFYSILVAPWNYYKNATHPEKQTMDDLQTWLSNDPNPDHWNLDLLYHLYWDTHILESGLITFLRNNMRSQKITYFIMTNGGMTVVSPKSEAKFFESMRDPRESSLYKRALHSPSCIYMADYSEAKRPNTSDSAQITMACGISIKKKISGQDLVIDKPVVVGARLSHDKLFDLVRDGMGKAGLDTTKLLSCDDVESLYCYLVDDGGFVVASNQDDAQQQIGRFLGQVDPTVMGKLLNEGYFLQTVQYDFQAACVKTDDTVSAGFKSFQIPSMTLLYEVLNVGWWTSKVSWAFVNFNLYSWLFSPSTQVWAEEDGEDEEKPCVEAMQQYYLEQRDPRPMTFGVQCQNCTRNYTVVKMRHTNLLFIVTDPMCEECTEEYPPLSQAPREVSEEEEESIICELAQNPRKRLQPFGCYHADPRENSKQCGCAALRVSYLSIFLVCLSVVRSYLSDSR